MGSRPRILFVDDEARILQGLQRMLHTDRRIWDMVFASGSLEALKILEGYDFDIVVTDMRMPIMDGAELLDTIRVKYPHSARMALSGHTEREFIFNAVASTHQFMSKPCDSEVLRTTLSNCIKARELIESPDLRALAGKTTSAPILASTYTAFLDSLDWGECNISRIGLIVAADIGLSAKCLQLVNSAFFGPPRQVYTAEEAVNMIGADALRAAYKRPDVACVFPLDLMQNIEASGLIDRSRSVARLVKQIGKHEQFSAQTIEQAALAAFLQDIGKLVLAAHSPKSYDYLRDLSGSDSLPMELDLLGATDSKLGAYLLSLWGFGAEIVEAVAWRHAPSGTTFDGGLPLLMVHAANVLAHEGAKNDFSAEEWDSDFLESKGMSNRIQDWRRLAGEPVRTGVAS
jgi:HD-like signal output (HDOD) protein/ActR/RegA family two-component response regulator